jgi:hypothetical protein
MLRVASFSMMVIIFYNYNPQQEIPPKSIYVIFEEAGVCACDDGGQYLCSCVDSWLWFAHWLLQHESKS